MQHVSGIITVVQEGRFRLASDDGRSHLFTLDNAARIEPQDLQRLLGGQVEVTYTAPGHLKALTAHEIRAAGEG